MEGFVLEGKLFLVGCPGYGRIGWKETSGARLRLCAQVGVVTVRLRSFSCGFSFEEREGLVPVQRSVGGKRIGVRFVLGRLLHGIVVAETV